MERGLYTRHCFVHVIRILSQKHKMKCSDICQHNIEYVQFGHMPKVMTLVEICVIRILSQKHEMKCSDICQHNIEYVRIQFGHMPKVMTLIEICIVALSFGSGICQGICTGQLQNHKCQFFLSDLF